MGDTFKKKQIPSSHKSNTSPSSIPAYCRHLFHGRAGCSHHKRVLDKIIIYLKNFTFVDPLFIYALVCQPTGNVSMLSYRRIDWSGPVDLIIIMTFQFVSFRS